MKDFVGRNLNNGDNSRFHVHSGDGFTDIHCHCLPALDDGPCTMSDSLELCRMLVLDGVSKVVATPHQLGRFDVEYGVEQIREAVRDLTASLKIDGIPLEVVPGAEVRVDERIHELLEADRILTLADGGKYILLELPHDVFIDIEPLLAELSSMGIESIIAHAERITTPGMGSRVLHRWLEHLTHLQVTASSLAGDFGPRLRRNAWELLTSGDTTLVATDAHDTNHRRPRMKYVYESICTKLDVETAYLVCVENPSRVVSGKDILSISIRNKQETS